MTARKRIFSMAARLTLVVGVIAVAPCPSRAQAVEAWPPWAQAVRTAEQTGRPIVLVVTSRSSVASQEFRRALATRVSSGPRAAGSAQFAELSMESNPELVKKLGISTVPTILVYRRGTSGLVLAGRKSAPLDDAMALEWLADHLAPAVSSHSDPAVVRTLGHKVSVQPSPQQVVGQPQVVTQPQVVVQQQPVTTTIQTTPTVSTPITGPQATPVVLQPSSAPVVVQPAATQVIVGPAPAPVVTFVQGPSSAPQVSLASPPTTQANLFVSGPQVQQQQPSMPSPQQTQVSTSHVAQTQGVQQQMVQLVPAVQAGQPMVQAGAGTQTAMLLQNPGLIGRLLGALGRMLVHLGNPRLVMNTATPVAVQVPAVAAMQVQTVAAPQQVTSAPPVQVTAPVVPSPQSGHHTLFGLFHHE